MDFLREWGGVFEAAGFSTGGGDGADGDGGAVLERFAAHVKKLSDAAGRERARAEVAELRCAVIALGAGEASQARLDGCLRLAQAYRADGRDAEEAALMAAEVIGLGVGARVKEGAEAGAAGEGHAAPDAARAVASGRIGAGRDWGSMSLGERAEMYRKDAGLARAMARAAGERLG